MGINSVPSFSSVNALLHSNSTTANRPAFDPAKFLNRAANQLLKKNDQDGDGDLDSSELSGLSQDAFNKLDSDGDGKVTKSEIKFVLQTQLDAIKKAFDDGGREGVKQYLDSIQGTPEGELLKALAPRLHGKSKPAEQDSQTPPPAPTTTTTTGTASTLDVLA